MLNWFQRLMAGRHGSDPLTFGILGLYCVLLLIANLFQLGWLSFLALALLVWAFYRMMSRNHEKRTRENEIFLSLLRQLGGWLAPVKRWFLGLVGGFKSSSARRTDKKTHVYLSCPGCKQQLRLPKGRGKLKAHCPKCGAEFEVKT